MVCNRLHSDQCVELTYSRLLSFQDRLLHVSSTYKLFAFCSVSLKSQTVHDTDFTAQIAAL